MTDEAVGGWLRFHLAPDFWYLSWARASPQAGDGTGAPAATPPAPNSLGHQDTRLASTGAQPETDFLAPPDPGREDAQPQFPSAVAAAPCPGQRRP